MAKNRHLIQDDQRVLQRWKTQAERQLGNFLDPDPTNDEENLTLERAVENYEDILEITKFNYLLDAVENATIRQKAFSLLMSNGALVVSDALGELENALKLKVENASKSVERAEAEAQNAENVLLDFQKRSREIVEKELNDDQCKEAIAQDFVKHTYLNSIPRIADNLFGKINEIFSNYKESTKYLYDVLINAIKNGRNQLTAQEIGKFGAKIQTYVESALEEECNPSAEGWFNNLIQSDGSIFQTTVKPKLRYVGSEIRRAWQEVVFNSNEEGVGAYLAGLQPNFATTQPIAVDVLRLFDSSGMLKELRGAMLKRLMAGIVAPVGGYIIGLVTNILTIFLLACVLPPSGLLALPATIIALIGAFITGSTVYDKLNQYFQQRINQGLRKRLEPELGKVFERRDVYELLMSSGFEATAKVFEGIRKYYDDAFNEQKNKFVKLRDEALSIKRKAAEEQRRIANDARQVREKVVGFRTQVDEFIAETKPFFKRASTETDA